MKLLTPEIAATIPPLYSTNGQGDEAIVHAKLLLPDSNWTWYILEFDGEDLCFGLVIGMEIELGYFTISELESLKAAIGMEVERDIDWQPITLAEVRQKIAKWGIA